MSKKRSLKESNNYEICILQPNNQQKQRLNDSLSVCNFPEFKEMDTNASDFEMKNDNENVKIIIKSKSKTYDRKLLCKIPWFKPKLSKSFEVKHGIWNILVRKTHKSIRTHGLINVLYDIKYLTIICLTIKYLKLTH